MNDQQNRFNWFLFLAMGVMWGSSYLFIKIGVETITPFTLIALRLAIGAALLGAVVLYLRARLPRDARMYGHLLVMSIINIVIPFALITWAELTVPSSLAAVLTGTVPLFVIVIAAFFLRDEPITANRLIGLLVGFAGVVVLTNPSGFGADGTAIAQLAILGAALSYAIGGVYARRFVSGLPPIIPAFMQVVLAFAISGTLALLFEQPFGLAYSAAAIGSLLWLGVLGSGVVYLIYFRLLRTWGATRTSLVAYVMPVVGIILGVAVAGETIDARIISGTVLVIAGVALVNSRYGRRPLFARGRRLEAVAGAAAGAGAEGEVAA
ncbi:MAG TPA: EamA family transporter [Candidatus Limnocylindrales bacterium]|nr:EamA family transporter [Candidatus Limnocylindrales bacterium]